MLLKTNPIHEKNIPKFWRGGYQTIHGSQGTRETILIATSIPTPNLKSLSCISWSASIAYPEPQENSKNLQLNQMYYGMSTVTIRYNIILICQFSALRTYCFHLAITRVVPKIFSPLNIICSTYCNYSLVLMAWCCVVSINYMTAMWFLTSCFCKLDWDRSVRWHRKLGRNVILLALLYLFHFQTLQCGNAQRLVSDERHT